MNKVGMSHTGEEISGVEYLRQRIEDVLKTPKGSIVLARGFGSSMHELIDENVDSNFLMSAYEKVTDAFTSSENDLDDCEFKSMSVDSENDQVTFTVRVIYNNENITLKGVKYG